MKIATWNVNSAKVRLPHLLEWLKRDAPKIVLLQEIKCVDEAFPAIEIGDLGYNVVTHGQKTYNGVAILSRYPLDDVRRGVPGNEDDPQARYIEAVASLPPNISKTGAVRVASVYVPNGSTADDPDKFPYKLRFLERFTVHMKTLLSYDEMLAVGGDYNIAPADKDVFSPKAWEGSVLTHDEVRRAFRRLQNLGLLDAFRLVHPELEIFSWWDYRAGAFDRNEGLRIDHVLLSPQAADKLTAAFIETSLRAKERASDHTPVIVELAV